MHNTPTDFQSSYIYKLFFDDIEEIFLHTISFHLLCILCFITCLFIIGILILIFYRSKQIFLTCLIPFIYSLILYDFIQLLSLILLKYNSNEHFLNKSCRWPYYLKSASDAGQCLTIIFIFILSRHQIRYFTTHNHLPNSSYIHSRVLALVCLLFVVYVNNWITHLKVEKIHIIASNETKNDMNVQELSVSLDSMKNITIDTHQRFINDLGGYSQGSIKSFIIESEQKISKDKIMHNHKDGSSQEIIIKFPYDYLFNTNKTQTKRSLNTIEQQQQHYLLNQKFDEKKYNRSYRINHCTYGQSNFFLTNFLGFINSIGYFILLLYYLIIIYAYKITDSKINYHKQFYEKPFSLGRKKSVVRRKHFILLIHLKQFLYLIMYSHTLFTFIRLIYVCLLTITLCFIQTPFKWLPVKLFFYSLFLISYLSIPLRMIILFIYCFLSLFSIQIRSIVFYLFNTNLHFSWKLIKPKICFRLEFIPYTDNCNDKTNIDPSVVIDLSSSFMEDPSNLGHQDSIIILSENNGSHNGLTTALVNTSIMVIDESTPISSAISKL